MISKHLESNIINKLGETPTKGQQKLIENISEFLLNTIEDEIFVITGYAGTGKTSVISAVINALDEFKIKTDLLAPTGRAAKVLSSFSGKAAFTIHKRIYRQKSAKDGLGQFMLGKNLSPGTFFIVDEASMIGSQTNEASIFGSGNLLDDLLEFVYSAKRCKLILIGDPAQLPPVGLNLSPALDDSNLKGKGFSVKHAYLTEVVRQTKDSGILVNATQVRNFIDEKNYSIPKIQHTNFKDVIKLSGEDLIDALTTCYEKFGIEETMVVTRSNKRANQFNEGIRKSILFREETLSKGDFLMVVKNNYFWLKSNEDEEARFIANGDIVEVIKTGKYEECYGFHFVNVKIRLSDTEGTELDCKLLLKTLNLENAALSSEDNKKMFYSVFEDYAHLKPKKAGYDAVKNNPYFNALQVKYAYAVTCHKAQGGQWKSVFVDQGYFVPDMLDVEYLRWLYTALTRASEKLYLVNFNKDFFDEV